MSAPSTASVDRDGARPPAGADDAGAPPARSLATRLRLGPLSGLYGIAVLVVFFGVTQPDLFLTETNLKVVLVNSAITGLLACGVLVAVLARQLDLSFGAVAGFAMVFFTWSTAHSDLNTYFLALAAIALAALFGLASGLLTAYFHLESLIVTLGMSSVALGLTKYITEGNTLVAELSPSFHDIGLKSVGPIPILVLIMLAVAAVVYVWLEHTPHGRFILACGNNPDAARLAGINVPRIQVVTLTFSATVAGLAGVLIVSRIGSATDTGATGYLLPVIAGIFLGSTQVMNRPNVIGTLIAIYLLGTGVQGIQLGGTKPWVNELFNGAVLLLAIAIAAHRNRPRNPARDTKRTGRSEPEPQPT